MDEKGRERLGIVAGGGSLPAIVADAARHQGYDPVFALFADGISNPSIDGMARGFTWGRTGDAIEWLRTQGVRRLVFCGTISARPDFRSVLPSWRTIRILPSALSIVRGGDDHLFRRLLAFIEREGFELLPVQDVAPELLTPPGVLTVRAPDARETIAIANADRGARMLGDLDAGQAVVASNERIVAMEGIEGTRGMMRRVADYRAAGKIGRGERLALVKAVKPNQDRRFDLPSIGTQTIEEAEAAGISAIGLSARESLILGYDDVVRAAARSNIALYGMPATQSGDEVAS